LSKSSAGRVAETIRPTEQESEYYTDRARSRTYHGSQRGERHQAVVASFGIDDGLWFWRHRHGWNLPHSPCNRGTALLWANLAAIPLGLSRLASAVANFAI
jgi:hypothetical protein